MYACAERMGRGERSQVSGSKIKLHVLFKEVFTVTFTEGVRVS